MDTPTRPISYTASNSTSTPSHSHNILHHSPSLCRHHHPHRESNLDTSTIRTPQTFNRSHWNTSSARKYSSPRLQPLIAIFEALDAESLSFNIRDAQPPHLQLPGSRMGRRGEGADVQQVKMTREKLLTLFDRPGWGARTLRGLRDGGNRRDFDDIRFGDEETPSRAQVHEAPEQSISPQRGNGIDGWIPNARPGLRRESRIMDRVRFFDGGIDVPPPGYNGRWKTFKADGEAPPQSPNRYQPVGSPKKLGLYSVFPSTHRAGHLTPIKSYGYLRPREITPLPWRPLDPRRWETVGQLREIPDTPNARSRTQDRAHHSLITPNTANAASAVKKVQITYQDPKRNVSEKVNILSTTRTRGEEQEYFHCEFEDENPRVVLASCPRALSGLETGKDHGFGKQRLFETKMRLETKGTRSVERLKPLRESRVQDQINLFSNGKINVKPITRMRNQSTPTKLPSQVAQETPVLASSKFPRHNGNARSQIEKRQIDTISVTAIDFTSSDVLLETVADQQLCQPKSQEILAETSAPRKSSGISEKIQHFEAFASSQGLNIGRAVVDSNRNWSSPRSKRIQTWPLPANDDVFGGKTQKTKVPEKSPDRKHARSTFEKTTNTATTNLTELQDDQSIKAYQDRERARQKIHSRQERLNRRSRSRSRSARRNPRPTEERDEGSRAFEHMKHNPGAIARTEKRKDTACGISQQSAMTPNVGLETIVHRQQPGDGRVQEIWIDGSEGGPPEELVAVDTIVAQCELTEPRPTRLVETLSMIRLCRGRFGERSGTWRRKMGRSSEKGGLAA